MCEQKYLKFLKKTVFKKNFLADKNDYLSQNSVYMYKSILVAIWYCRDMVLDRNNENHLSKILGRLKAVYLNKDLPHTKMLRSYTYRDIPTAIGGAGHDLLAKNELN